MSEIKFDTRNNGYQNGYMPVVQPWTSLLQNTLGGAEEKGNVHLRQKSKSNFAYPEKISEPTHVSSLKILILYTVETRKSVMKSLKN